MVPKPLTVIAKPPASGTMSNRATTYRPFAACRGGDAFNRCRGFVASSVDTPPDSSIAGYAAYPQTLWLPVVGAVNEQGSVIGRDGQGPPLVFISYATADRTEALKVCEAIERRGTKCWISMRDVPPGANYQEAIVQSLRTARAVALVFSDAANTSNEIKKELSLASRYQVPVIALRLKDVEPSDAFAYELSTRQWINAFEGWDRSIDTLVGRIDQIAGSGPVAPAAATPASRRTAFSSGRAMAIAAAGLLSLVAAAGAWWALRPPQAAAHSMTVRLAGFQLLSADLPATLRGYRGRGDYRGIQRRRRCGGFGCTSPRAGRGASLHTGRDNPAGRRHDPCHHSHGQRALRRNLVV